MVGASILSGYTRLFKAINKICLEILMGACLGRLLLILMTVFVMLIGLSMIIVFGGVSLVSGIIF